MSDVDLLRAWRDETRNTPEHRSHKLTISASRHWQTVDMLLDHAGELEAIVRDLAAEDPCNGDDDYRCALCGETHGDHDDRCAFARAQSWVSAHPVSGDPQ